MPDRDKLVRVLPWYGLALVIIVLDLLTKAWVSGYLQYGESKPITSFFNLVLVHNYGAAFSFLSDAGGWQRWFFTALALAVSVWIVIWLYRAPEKNTWLLTGLALVLGGAIGNLWERLVQGYVVDFIDIYYQGYHWPAFNLADSAICVGVALLLFDSLINKGETS